MFYCLIPVCLVWVAYRGMYEEKLEVAVKRIVSERYELAEREVSLMDLAGNQRGIELYLLSRLMHYAN